MKKHHRFIGKFGIDAERLLIRETSLVHQVRDVLKLRTGEGIVLSDGTGTEAICGIRAVDKGSIEVEVIERCACPEPTRDVTLWCAMLKAENFELAVEKAVECGVRRIVPVVTARTVKLGIKAGRLEKIAQEAAEQSGRGMVPSIDAPMKFAEAVKSAISLDENCFFDASGEDFFRPKTLSRNIGLWIGPEGGWEDFELKSAALNRFSLYSLGKRVLRAETAATVAVFLSTR
jgi:16S rRNA (uracil1498-N3)-methyltransferase